MVCDFCSKKKKPFFETKHWRVFLSGDQSYLGRIFIFLNRHAESISELTKEEWIDLLEMMKKFESAALKAFGARLFNWSCLMNNAFQEKNPKPHVHWHCRPRYDEQVEFAGLTFIDSEFGHHYIRERKREVSKEVVTAIQNELLRYLK